MRQMKKMFAVAAMAAVVMAGCAAPEGNTSQVQAGPVVPSSSQMIQLEQNTLTMEKKQEIENAWYTATSNKLNNWYTEEGETITDGVRYYGTYDGLDILFDSTQLPAVSHETIGDATFSHSSSFALYAYSEGRFRNLKEVYETGEISDEDVKRILQVHEDFQRRIFPLFQQEGVDTDVLHSMKLTFLEQFIKEDGHSADDLSVVYYGEYEGAHVGFINGIFVYTQAFSSETVGGFTFHYSTGQRLLLYFDGELMRLGEAYERGILSDESLAALHRAYQKDDTSHVRE